MRSACRSLSCGLALVACSCGRPGAGLGLGAADKPAISPDNLRTHLRFLASDEMRGRANGSPELERAASTSPGSSRARACSPAASDGWYQPFEVMAGLTVGEGNALSISARGKTP